MCALQICIIIIIIKATVIKTVIKKMITEKHEIKTDNVKITYNLTCDINKDSQIAKELTKPTNRQRRTDKQGTKQ